MPLLLINQIIHSFTHSETRFREVRYNLLNDLMCCTPQTIFCVQLYLCNFLASSDELNCCWATRDLCGWPWRGEQCEFREICSTLSRFPIPECHQIPICLYIILFLHVNPRWRILSDRLEFYNVVILKVQHYKLPFFHFKLPYW